MRKDVDTRRSRRVGRGRKRLMAGTAAFVSVVAGAGLLALPGGGTGPGGPAVAAGTPIGSGDGPETHPAASRVELAGEPATFVVDPAVRPARPQIAGLDGEDRPRPVGRLVTADGTASDVVLSELVVGTADAEALDAFLARWQGRVVDRLDAGTALVRIAPDVVDTSRLAADLERFEPVHRGVTRASDQATLDLLAALARETAGHGTEVALNWVTAADDVAGGRVVEGFAPKPNAFDWSFIRAGGGQDTGVGAAWQLLEHHDRFSNKVRMMIDDGGFHENPDFPSWRKIRKADWGDGHEFVFHGTNVALTAMGTLDNGYGTAGPAGPVGELVAVSHAHGMWDALKRVRDMVDEEVPHVLNMSWGSEITFAMAAAKSLYDGALEDIAGDGVLAFASAGNRGIDVDSEACIGSTCWETRLVYPCESTHVICVGGLAPNSPWKDTGSNYGTKTGSQTVEIYGPYTTVGLGNPKYPDTMLVSGTSFASPFVAGVAALVRAADPGLDAGQIWAFLRDTAHRDGVGFAEVVSGHRRRVDALDAVAAALGVAQGAPSVSITAPGDGEELLPGEWVELTADAVDFKGTRLAVEWAVDGAVHGGGPVTSPIGLELEAVGEHRITATTVDLNGATAADEITVHVVRPAPEVRIATPGSGDAFWQTAGIALSGESGDPATHAPLPEGAVRWTVRTSGGGPTVFSAAGHQVEVPPGALAPGSYTVELTGDNGATASDTASFTVKAVPAGQTPPTPVIVTPEAGTLGSVEGHPVAVTLEGMASDHEDGALAGTRFRWTVTGPDEKEHVVCQGSAVPGGGGGIVLPKDCTTVDIELEAGYGLETGKVLYTIELRVWDSAGLDTATTVDVSVQYLAS
ncbi:MAG: S8 family serine peptidase [Actinomycetota bacterium]